MRNRETGPMWAVGIKKEALQIDKDHKAEEELLTQKEMQKIAVGAYFSSDWNLLERMLELGCHVGGWKSREQGMPLISYAVKFANTTIVRLLIKYGVDVNVVDSSGRSPLDHALPQDFPSEGHVGVAKLLIESGGVFHSMNAQKLPTLSNQRIPLVGLWYESFGLEHFKKEWEEHGDVVRSILDEPLYSQSLSFLFKCSEHEATYPLYRRFLDDLYNESPNIYKDVCQELWLMALKTDHEKGLRAAIDLNFIPDSPYKVMPLGEEQEGLHFLWESILNGGPVIFEFLAKDPELLIGFIEQGNRIPKKTWGLLAISNKTVVDLLKNHDISIYNGVIDDQGNTVFHTGFVNIKDDAYLKRLIKKDLPIFFKENEQGVKPIDLLKGRNSSLINHEFLIKCEQKYLTMNYQKPLAKIKKNRM